MKHVIQQEYGNGTFENMIQISVINLINKTWYNKI